jgi:hydrogenase maturation protein HypF
MLTGMHDRGWHRVRVTAEKIPHAEQYCSFIYNLVQQSGVGGQIVEAGPSMVFELEGERETLHDVLEQIVRNGPARLALQYCANSFVERSDSGSAAPDSSSRRHRAVAASPDLAACPECVAEIFDRNNRRYLYPFTSCSHCGPRFSVTESLPFHRARTTLKKFQMCPECHAEYSDSNSRRFGSQLNACPKCGPRLELWNECGETVAYDRDALQRAAVAVSVGLIVAVKGLGGIELMADTGHPAAVRRLLNAARHTVKSLPVMYPSLTMLKEHVSLCETEERILRSPAAPVLVFDDESADRRDRNAPASALLPYTPLQHLLLRHIGTPVTLARAVHFGEPHCIDEVEALARFRHTADFYLVHNWPIGRSVDGSVIRVVEGRELVLRRGRGLLPMPLAQGA